MKTLTKLDKYWYPANFDWYLKWAGSVICMISLALRAAGPEYRMYDLCFGAVGMALWTWVGVIWNDRALMMLNSVAFFVLVVAILKDLS